MIIVLDTETTGIGKQDQVIQLATIAIPDSIALLKEQMGQKPIPFVTTNNYYNPTCPINPHAQKVHGLSKIKLCKYPSSVTCKLDSEVKMIVAHNAPFDSRMLKVTHLNQICTISLAKKIEKLQGGKIGFTNYQLHTMFTYYYPEQSERFKTVLHDALGDTTMCLMILVKLLDQFPFLSSLTEVHKYFWSTDA